MVAGPGDADMIARVALATGLGAAVGLERELADKVAGLRTLALVALASCAFTVAGLGAIGLPEVAQFKPDPTRIAAQVVSGIGFLGAGIIVFTRGRIRGLTTAADLWAVSAVGVLCGLGLLAVAATATGMAVLVAAGFRPVERALARMRGRASTVPLVEGFAPGGEDDEGGRGREPEG